MRASLVGLLVFLAACHSDPKVRALTATETAAAAAWRAGFALCLEENRLVIDGASWSERTDPAQKATKTIDGATQAFLRAARSADRLRLNAVSDALGEVSRSSAAIAAACNDQNDDLAELCCRRLAASLDDLHRELSRAGLSPPP